MTGERTYGRRELLAAAAGTAALGVAGCLRGGGSEAGDENDEDEDDEEENTPVVQEAQTYESDRDGPAWVPAVTPTGKGLHSVTATRNGPYAVGDDGILLGRSDIGWALVLDSGPAHDTNALYDVASTTNGRVIWFAGSSGTVGRYDVVDETLEGFPAPKEKTSTWETVGVFGTAGREWVYLANGSGELIRGRYRGEKVKWSETTKPGSGTTIEDVSFADNDFGYLCDSSGSVFATKGNGKWKQTGIEGSGNALFDVAPFGKERAAIAADDGIIFRFNGFEWTGQEVGTATLYGIDRRKQAGVAVGEGGVIYELGSDGWGLNDRRASGALHSVVLGQGQHPPVAVGEAGTIIERRTNDR